MLNSTKIYGAGSIGNHLANAARRLGMSVVLCDIDPAALERARLEIYPGRYGSWDTDIELTSVDDAPKGESDLIIVGTPPDSHVELAMIALEERPKALLIEKPLSTPSLDGLLELRARAAGLGVEVFVGYDHAVSTSISKLESIVKKAEYGDLVTLDVEFREHWHGIFSAHPWLDGPKDTYLGYWQRGGGACGEHSHAINMWQHLSDICAKGRISMVSAELEYINDGVCDYDRLCMVQVETENGMKGRIVQDVVTYPVRKEAFMQFESGALHWQCGGDPKGDLVTHGQFPNSYETLLVEKTRPDDFISELTHIKNSLKKGTSSPISLEKGLETMLIIAACHLSGREGRKVSIDYSKGPVQAALQLL
jgi:predicted dehydrogenase